MSEIKPSSAKGCLLDLLLLLLLLAAVMVAVWVLS